MNKTAKTTIEDVIGSLPFPKCIGSWQEDEIVPDEPWVEYHRQDVEDADGDDVVAAKQDVWQLSLYGKQRTAFEFWDRLKEIEDILDGLDLYYTRSGDIFFDDVIYSTFSFTLLR